MSDTPRLPPLPVDEWDAAAREAFPALMKRPDRFFGPDPQPMPNVMGLLAQHVPLGAGWLAFNDVLANQTSLDVRLRELIILRVAWVSRCAYEWGQHTRIARRAGLTVDQLHAIPQGASADSWSPVERLVLAATDQLVDHITVDDETWAGLARHFDSSQILEVLFVAGAYTCFAMVCNAAGLQPDSGIDRIDAPEFPDQG